MSRKPYLPLIMAGVLWSALAGVAQTGPAAAPMPPITSSPVELFRLLILTNAAGREQFLAGKSPSARRIIETKLREYEELTLAQREEKLRSLQLRWQALQMMRLQPADRAASLAALPPADRTNIQRRLGPWDILPPRLQQEVLSNELVVHVLVQGESKPGNGTNASTEEERKKEMRKQELLVHFKEFLDLRPADQNKALSKLTATDRQQMEKTLANLSSLPKAEREQAFEGFKKFAELSAEERVEFLKMTDRWQSMTDKDRRLWRTIVDSLQRAKLNPPPMPTNSKPEESTTLVGTNGLN